MAAKPHDFAFRQQAKQALMYPEVHFTGEQAREIGSAFEGFVQKSGLIIWACSILPEHVHLVVARHRYKIEQIVNLLKGAATTRLMEQELHPLATFARNGERPPPMWVRGKWKVFLDCEEDIIRAIRYVEQNPIKDGKPAQHWGFVTRFEGLSV